MQVETKYARSGDLYIAYQVIGDGPMDVVFAPGFVSHLENDWEEPRMVHFLENLSKFCRLIRFDKRGTGLSDRAACPSLETRMDDVRAVMDDAGSERAALVGYSEGGSMAAMFAATYPERTTALVMYGTFAKFTWSEDYPWALSPERIANGHALIEKEWGNAVTLPFWAPSLADDEAFKKWWSRFERTGASPGAARALLDMNLQIDIRPVLSSIHTPTLVLHRTGDAVVQVDGARWMSEQIPGAKFVELEGDDHAPFVGDAEGLVGEIEEFLTGVRHAPEVDRILATVMFTDIVGSTERASEMGDHKWKQLLEDHHARIRKQLDVYRGREVDTAGDGFLAAFDGPGRAIKCAQAAQAAVRELGVDIRAGLHTGECEVFGDKLSGVAVHIGSRVMGQADGPEVMVSSTVKDLVAGSGIEFEERGEHVLKGVPGEWRLFAVRP